MFKKHFKSLIAICFGFGAMTFTGCGDDEDPIVEDVIYTVSIQGQASVSEADGNTSFTIALDQDNETGAGLTVSYVLGGTATSGSDYQAPSGFATVADGERQVSVQLTITDDTEDENDETITVELSSTGLPSNLSVGASNSISITLTDNDSPSVVSCSDDNSISTAANSCSETASVSNTYNDNTINADNKREIVTNGVPSHDFNNQLKSMGVSLNTGTKTYLVATDPSKAGNVTSVLTPQNRPRYRFGVAKNGVPMDPAPAEPFIFTDNNGEFNWDWVFEPTNNTADVNLDCAYAHVQPDGTYHYHGDMVEYANELLAGLGDGTATPTNAIQIGWASDGFPVYYKYGPTNTNGTGAELLTSSYQVKSGDRPGDGSSEPCGEYNGKYTNDYEFVASSGDLDECNGMDRSVTIGSNTYEYFYVITNDFPVIPRCMAGAPDDSFLLGM